jgi:RimJ/RimL family protein N-acetyltransferase
VSARRPGAPERFATERLTAERLTEGHWPELRTMEVDPRVMATLGGVRTEQQSRDYLDLNLEQWRRHGFGVWVLRTAGDGAYAGRAGLRTVEWDGVEEVELAYALVADLHGRGLATEVSRAILRIAFEQVGLEDVVGFTALDNLRSRRVMEKCGLTFEREIFRKGMRQVLYRLRAECGRGAGQTSGRPSS